MTQGELKSRMEMLSCFFIPRLSNKDILDFCNADVLEFEKENTQRDENILMSQQRKTVDNPPFVKYSTKKAVLQDIKKHNQNINRYMERRREAEYPYYDDACIEIELEKKEILQKKLSALDWARTHKTEGVDEKVLARAVPIENFIEFNSAGFAICPFHADKKPSFHKIRGKNVAYCFAGCGIKNTIDVCMAVRGIDFKSALKIILK